MTIHTATTYASFCDWRNRYILRATNGDETIDIFVRKKHIDRAEAVECGSEIQYSYRGGRPFYEPSEWLEVIEDRRGYLPPIGSFGGEI